jgi:hypothetical protein
MFKEGWMMGWGGFTNTDVALLVSEWSVAYDHRHAPGRCPVCGDRQLHETGCELDLALGERGFGTQTERDAARARIVAARRM